MSDAGDGPKVVSMAKERSVLSNHLAWSERVRHENHGSYK
jgi:hypothetical protein